MLVAFAVAVQAGDDKSTASDKDKPACCAKAKSGDQAKSCPMAKQAKASSCPYAGKTAKDTTAKDTTGKQVVVASPKAAADATK